MRRRAALAAGRIADPAVPALVDLMNDPDPELRQMAAFGLGLIGDRRGRRLVASLKDIEGVVRARAAEALGRIGDPRAAPDVAQIVLEPVPKAPAVVTVRGDDPGNPNDPWLELRLGLFALAAAQGRRRPAARPCSRTAEPRFDWWAAAFVAMRLESPLLRPACSRRRRRTIGWRAPSPPGDWARSRTPSAVDTLVTLARDPDETVAVTALRALGHDRRPPGRARVAAALARKDLTLKREALSALAVAARPTAACARASFPTSATSRP